MSRIGRLPVEVPPQVKVAIEGRTLSVEGPKGKLRLDLPPRTRATLKDGRIQVTADGADAAAKALHGLCRALVQNMVVGVQAGYVKKLEIHGVGFKAAVKGQEVNLILGYSHPISYALPDQVKVTVEENTKLTVEGPDKQAVGQVAADLRRFYPPEPYKGKGIRYAGEKIVRKEGKTVQ
jgi:large subunit ribosomal protein L6